MKFLFALLLMFTTILASAQTDSLKNNPITISGYVEAYYTFDFGKPADHNRPSFIYSHNRHNEVTLNLGLVKANYETKNVRANLALMAGTYANANLAAEPGVLKNIYEANAGVKISRTKNLWVDAGILSSHIGFESAIGKDCWTLTRSIAAENSPYYESGAKISYTSENGKWFASGLVLNGWQRIQRPDGNNTAAFGHQLTFKPNDKVTLNSSSFIGNDKPDSVRQERFFHDLYGIFQISDKVALTTAFDIGAEQKFKGSKAYNCWYSPIVILKINTNDKNSFALRGEYYSDKNGVLISTGTPHGFQTWGYSVNYDYEIKKNFLWRVEARGFSGKDKTFVKENIPVNNNFFLTSSLAVSF